MAVKEITIRKVFFGIVFLEALSLCWFMAISPHRFVSDEGGYIPAARLVWKYGLSKKFLLSLPGQAGPLHTWVHALFAPLTGLNPPGIRLVNLFWLGLIMGAITLTFRILKYSASWQCAFLILSLPHMYFISGLALTEIPAMAFFAFATALSLYSLHSAGLKSWIFCVLAGACWIAALLGRQTYLPALLALTIYIARGNRFWPKMLLIMLLALLPFGWVVSVWGGLTPPAVAYMSRGFTFSHIIFGLAYAGLSILIISPQWFGFKRRSSVAVFILTTCGNVFFHLLKMVPLRSVASNFLPERYLEIYGFLSGGILLWLAVMTLLGFCERAWQKRNDTAYLYFVIAALGILICSSIKTPLGFSSRYAIGAAPLLILLAAPYVKFNMLFILRILFGWLAGLLILSNYMHFA